MTNEQILEQQVEALEKLLQLKQAIVEELEAKVARLQATVIDTTPNYIPWISSPWLGGGLQSGPSSGTITITNMCPDGVLHQYGGASANRCARCGQTTTITTLTGDVTASTTTNINHRNNNLVTLTSASKK